MSAFNEVNDWAPKLPNTDFKIIGTLLPSNSGIVWTFSGHPGYWPSVFTQKKQRRKYVMNIILIF